MAPEKDACAKPSKGPIVARSEESSPEPEMQGEASMSMARVGHEAPDFETTAYVAGKGFENVQLSDYRGKWVLLCFYPGDFTFV